MSDRPGARYTRDRVGYLDDVKASDLGRYTFAWMRQSASRGVTPGLLRQGVAGLAEEINWALSKLRRHLGELTCANLVLVDERARVMFIVGAISEDPPRNPQAVQAMARQLSDLPDCEPVKAAVIEVLNSIDDLDRARKAAHEKATKRGERINPEPVLRERWHEQYRGPYSNGHSNEHSAGISNAAVAATDSHACAHAVPPPPPVPATTTATTTAAVTDSASAFHRPPGARSAPSAPGPVQAVENGRGDALNEGEERRDGSDEERLRLAAHDVLNTEGSAGSIALLTEIVQQVGKRKYGVRLLTKDRARHALEVALSERPSA